MSDQRRHFAQHQDLLLTLTLRELQVRYKQTFLGVGWAMVQPLAFMAILTFLKGVIFGEAKSEGVPHAIFIYCAMVPWVFFQNSLTFATTSLALNMRLVKKIYFPRELFPCSAVLACLVDFVIALSLVGGMMACNRIPLTANLLWLPVLIAVELVFVLSLGLLALASNVFYRDMQYLILLGVPCCLTLLTMEYGETDTA